MKRLQEKLDEIKKYTQDLEEIIPEEFAEYQKDKVIRAACERYVEKIVEAITDAAFLYITTRKLSIPEDDIDAFRILKEKHVLSEELYRRLKQAKGMRNILAHQYGRINDETVYETIKHELAHDARAFIKEMKQIIE